MSRLLECLAKYNCWPPPDWYPERLACRGIGYDEWRRDWESWQPTRKHGLEFRIRLYDRWAQLMDARASLARRSADAQSDDDLDALTDQIAAIESAVIAAPNYSPGAVKAKVDLGFALWREGCPVPPWFEEMVRQALCENGAAR